MEKRARGIRSRIYFDQIDLQILHYLNEHNYKTIQGAYSVSELLENLKINSKTLKQHLDKLLLLKLILTTPLQYHNSDENNDVKKYGLTTPNVLFEFLREIDQYSDLPDHYFNEDKKSSERFLEVLKLLEEVQSIYHEMDSKKSIDIDLRSKESLKKFENSKVNNK